MTSVHEGHLDFPTLPPTATVSHIVPEMTTHNLLSIGQLCDAGCTATVTKDKIEVTHNSHMILTGTRSEETTLWHIDFPSEVEPETLYCTVEESAWYINYINNQSQEDDDFKKTFRNRFRIRYCSFTELCHDIKPGITDSFGTEAVDRQTGNVGMGNS